MRKELWFGFSLIALIMIPVIVLTPWTHLTNGHLGLLMLALICVGIMLGFPTAFTLMGMGVFFAWLAYRSVNPALAPRQVLDLFVQRTYGVMSNDVLIAIPLFLFMGYLVERAKLIDKLFHSLHLATARVPGALAVATIVTCSIFATATGIVGACVTLMGLLALPALLKAGYDVKGSAGAITAGGCLGILIPPSVLLIVYGAVAGVSVVQLYAGAFLPGFMLAGLYIGYIIVLAKWKPHLMPPLAQSERRVELPTFAQRLAKHGSNALIGLTRAVTGDSGAGVAKQTALGQLFVSLLPALFIAAVLAVTYRLATAPEVQASTAEVFKMLLASFFPLALLIIAVLGSIVFGLSTPSEAAAVGAFGGFILAGIYRFVDHWRRARPAGPSAAVVWETLKELGTIIKESSFLTAKTSAMVCWLFVGSGIFSAAFALLGGQEVVEKWVLSLDMTPVQFMILAQFIIFILGWPLEWTEIIIIFMPIFLPL